MQRKQRERYVVNNYDINKESVETITKEIKVQIDKNLTILENNYPCQAKHKITSLGEKRNDCSFYTGTGGNIYLYWRKYLYDKSNKESLSQMENAYKSNYQTFKKTYSSDFEIGSNSFFFSPSGLYSLGCILYNEKNDKELFIENLNHLLSLKSISDNPNSEDELLYGTAGYLYSLLLVKTKCSIINYNTRELDNTIVSIAHILLNHGKNYMSLIPDNNILLYPFPKTSKRGYSLYLGAAHGVIGVLYQILCAIKLFPNEFSKEENKLIQTSLYAIVNLQYKTGNFQSHVDEQDNDTLVHFCHGCTGAVHLFFLAYHIYKDNTFLNSAILCGDSLWKRGLLLKGNGVCHGISGTAYSLYKIYKETNNKEYYTKAYVIAKGTYDPYVQDKVKVTKDPQRKSIGIPDTPYSLMEGMGGTMSMYYDLIGDKMEFPGYEIF